jgi:hypothetical protein
MNSFPPVSTGVVVLVGVVVVGDAVLTGVVTGVVAGVLVAGSAVSGAVQLMHKKPINATRTTGRIYLIFLLQIIKQSPQQTSCLIDNVNIISQ